MDELVVDDEGLAPPGLTDTRHSADPPAEQARRDPAPVVDLGNPALLDALDSAVVVCDPLGVVRHLNTAATRLLPGVTTGEVPDVAGGIPEWAKALAESADRFEAVTDDQVCVGSRGELPGGWTVWQVRDVTDQRAREDALLAERTRSRFLARASRQLGLSLHPGRTERAVVTLACELATAATIVTSGDRDSCGWRHADGSGIVLDGQCARADLPPGLLAALTGTATGSEPHAAAHFISPNWLPEIELSRFGEAEVVSLPGTELSGAALVLWRAPGDPTPSVVEPDRHGDRGPVVAEFAARAGTALAAARLHAQQTRMVTALKAGLVPPRLPQVPGLEFGSEYRPALQSALVGGDFYEVTAGPGEDVCFAFGDVMGKGAEAAVITGTVRQSLNALRRAGCDQLATLGLLNDTLLAAPDPGAQRFVSLVLGSLRRAANGFTMDLAGGGHLPPLLLRRDGSVEPVWIGGMLVGALPGASFRSVPVALAPGESCVLYTDGITEVHGGVDGRELFGVDRLIAALERCQAMPANAIAERVAVQAHQWASEGPRDDIAVLVIQATRS